MHICIKSCIYHFYIVLVCSDFIFNDCNSKRGDVGGI